jgi:hypothetical protein
MYTMQGTHTHLQNRHRVQVATGNEVFVLRIFRTVQLLIYFFFTLIRFVMCIDTDD